MCIKIHKISIPTQRDNTCSKLTTNTKEQCPR